MMKVKQLMVETLLTVTSEEIRSIAEEVYKRAKVRAKQGRYPQKEIYQLMNQIILRFHE